MYRLIRTLGCSTLICCGLVHAQGVPPWAEPNGALPQPALPKRVLLLSSAVASRDSHLQVLSMAQALSKMEHAQGSPIHQNYDLIIGNGQAGMLALHLARGRDATSFVYRALHVFPEAQPVSFWEKIPFLRKILGRERHTHLEGAALRRMLGDDTMQKLVVPAAVAVREEDPKFANDWMLLCQDHPSLPLWQAAHAAGGMPGSVPVQLEGVARSVQGGGHDHAHAACFAYTAAQRYFAGAPLELLQVTTQGHPDRHSYSDHLLQYLSAQGARMLSLRVGANGTLGGRRSALDRALIAGEHIEIAHQSGAERPTEAYHLQGPGPLKASEALLI